MAQSIDIAQQTQIQASNQDEDSIINNNDNMNDLLFPDVGIQNADEEELQFGPDTITDLIELMQDKKAEVQKQTLHLIIQFANSKANRLHFLTTQFINLLLKMFANVPQFSSICLTILIKFAEDDIFCEQMYNNNVFNRVMEFVKESHALYMKTLAQQQGNGTDKQLHRLIELSIFLISNLTRTEEGVKQFLQLNDDQLKLLNLKLMLSYFTSKGTNFSMFRFVPSIIANISAQPLYRSTLTSQENNIQIFQICREYIHSKDLNTRVSFLKILRNCSFEQDNNKYVQDQLCTVIAVPLFNLMLRLIRDDADLYDKLGENVKDELHKLLQQVQYEGESQSETIQAYKSSNPLEELSLCIDIFVVMTNIECIDKLVQIKEEQFDKMLFILKLLIKKQSIVDQIFVLLAIFCHSI